MELSKEIKQNWTGLGNFEICFCVSFNCYYRNSAVSRAILKPIYRFGIPNSQPQTLKNVDLWCKLSSTFVVAEPRERCLELFIMQNDSPAAQRFFSLLRSSKNRHPKKLLHKALQNFISRRETGN